jgi:hypothetical protein
MCVLVAGEVGTGATRCSGTYYANTCLALKLLTCSRNEARRRVAVARLPRG